VGHAPRFDPGIKDRRAKNGPSKRFKCRRVKEMKKIMQMMTASTARIFDLSCKEYRTKGGVTMATKVAYIS